MPGLAVFELDGADIAAQARTQAGHQQRFCFSAPSCFAHFAKDLTRWPAPYVDSANFLIHEIEMSASAHRRTFAFMLLRVFPRIYYISLVSWIFKS